MAREADAADLNHQIKRLGIASYAGGWFDSETWNLHVAISDARDRALIERLGATAIMVDHNLESLTNAKATARAALSGHPQPLEALKKVYIDFPSNKVIVGISPDSAVAARNMFRSRGLDEGVLDVVEVDKTYEFAADVKGADGVENQTINEEDDLDGLNHPCSIGVSVVDGFAFAGHCGQQGADIDTENGSADYGYVTESTMTRGAGFELFADDHDSAQLDTNSGWTPKPIVNDYSGGTITVKSKWAGMRLTTAGATVCRYGQETGGPHCGEVVTTDADGVPIGGSTFDDQIETEKVCIEDGDSGGPLLTGAGDQIQGTLAGGLTEDCPSKAPSNEAFFQKIKITLDNFGLIMLTSHGANAPTIANLSCSGGGYSTFSCSTSYHAQGETTLEQYLNGSFFGTGTGISGTCAGGQSHSVAVDATTTYGTGSDSTSFFCYSGALP